MDDTTTAVKLLISYEVKADSSQAYYQFVMGQLVPTMQEHGLQMSEAWHTAYGDAPNRLIGFVSSDMLAMEEFLDSSIWTQLYDQLEEFVTDLSYKVIPYRLGFQL